MDEQEKTKEEKLAVVLRLAEENEVSANSIAVANKMGAYGVLKILKKQTKKPQDRTVDALYDYMISKYGIAKNNDPFKLSDFSPRDIITYIVRNKSTFENDPSYLLFEELIYHNRNEKVMKNKVHEIIEVVNKECNSDIKPFNVK